MLLRYGLWCGRRMPLRIYNSSGTALARQFLDTTYLSLPCKASCHRMLLTMSPRSCHRMSAQQHGRSMECTNIANHRHFSSFAGSSLKAGMIFLHGDRYCEVVSNRQVKQGRGSASIQLEYIDLSNKKQMTLNLPIGAKVEKIDLDRQTTLVQYLDEDARELVVSDQNFEDMRVPVGLIGEGAKLLEAGDELQLFYHERTIVKVGLPNTIVSRMKKK